MTITSYREFASAMNTARRNGERALDHWNYLSDSLRQLRSGMTDEQIAQAEADVDMAYGFYREHIDQYSQLVDQYADWAARYFAE